MPAAPTPSVGRVVHYTSHGSADGTYSKECRAADITSVGAWVDTHVVDHGDGTRTVQQTWEPDTCALFVKNPTGVFLNTAVRHEELPDGVVPVPDNRSGGTWHWPERT